MTVFVASLFLPHTVSFDVGTSSSSSISPSPSPIPTTKRPTTSSSLSFVSTTIVGPLVQTPGATTDHEQIFMPQAEKPFKLSMPQLKGAQINGVDRSSSLRPPTPRMMSRTDLHSPIWGQQKSRTQPASRAKSPPPVSILMHNAVKPRTPSLSWNPRPKHSAHERHRNYSHERQFTHENYVVQPAQIGNGGLYNAINAASDAGILPEKTWVGTLGMPTDALTPQLKEVISEKLEWDYESLAVYVDDSDFSGHYEHYCKTMLWPVFHYQIPDHPKSKAYEDHSWEFYVKVNQAFADRIVKNYKKGDVIWVHDYHLLLVPGMIRQKLPDAQIGFFLHTAFPSSEIFRCLAVRSDLLQGMLGANLIGFQTEEYCHHFSQTCSRILNVEASKSGIILEDGRLIHIGKFPIGIDPKGLDERRSLPEVSEWISTIAQKYKGKRLLVARDKLDNNIRGVRQKMLSYEIFLDRYPEYRNDVVLIQIATSTTEQPDLSAAVAEVVMRINSTYSTLAHQPVVFLTQDIDHSQYLALLSVAESLLVTSLREGMNLTCHEFVYCQDGRYADTQHAALVLSEFTGSASVLDHNALLVNPWDLSNSAAAMKEALSMSKEERERRWRRMHAIVGNQNAVQWYESYIDHLRRAWEEHTVRDNTSVPRLSFQQLQTRYLQASKRLLILDYEGTLAQWGAPGDIVMTTPKKATDILNDLIEDRRNIVYVMSARTPEELERQFRQVPGLGLIAENGAFLLEPDTDEWFHLTDLCHVTNWKKGVRSILTYYADRIEGSRIEDRHSALIFDYSEAEDKASAFKQAGECANHINDACQKQYIHAVPRDNMIFVSDMEVNKSTATNLIIQNMLQSREATHEVLPDFMLVVGDSREDEFVFSWAHDLQKKEVIRDVCTVTLGARNTGASHTLTQGITGVLSTLRKLTMLS